MTFPRSDEINIPGLPGTFKLLGVKEHSSRESPQLQLTYESCRYDDPGVIGWHVQYKGWFYYNGILRTPEEVMGLCEFAANLYRQGKKDKLREIKSLLEIP